MEREREKEKWRETEDCSSFCWFTLPPLTEPGLSQAETGNQELSPISHVFDRLSSITFAPLGALAGRWVGS